MFIQLITTKQHFGHHLKLSLREAAINTLMCTLIQFALWSTNLCLCWNSQFASLLGGKWYCQICIICSTSSGESENDFRNQYSTKFFLFITKVPFLFYFFVLLDSKQLPFQVRPLSDWWCPGRSLYEDHSSCWMTVSPSNHPSGTETYHIHIITLIFKHLLLEMQNTGS